MVFLEVGKVGGYEQRDKMLAPDLLIIQPLPLWRLYGGVGCLKVDKPGFLHAVLLVLVESLNACPERVCR